MKKILLVFGTRPEAVKMCPLVQELRARRGIQTVVCVTGQHREMLDQILKTFSVVPDYDLSVMKDLQTLFDVTTGVLEGLKSVLEAEKPDVVLVQGDTTTAFAAALAAYYLRIPVGHVEAGLRTGDIYSPFPEEMNRLLTDRISTYYYAPTQKNRENLLREGIRENIFVTGNTVIDAFQYTVSDRYTFHEPSLQSLDFSGKRVILVTAHRRENLGKPLQQICKAIQRLAVEYPDVLFVYPVHLNPAVRETVFPMLGEQENVMLTNPVDVLDMHNLMSRCYMVMTDSGGIQEEAPHFGKPVLVLRTETERPEAVEAGTVKVTGTQEETIYREAKLLLDDAQTYAAMAQAVNPYGDGHASRRIVEAILEMNR